MPKRKATLDCLLNQLDSIDMQDTDKPFILIFGNLREHGKVAVKLASENDEYVALEQKNIVYVTKVIVPLTPHMLGALAVGHCKASEWLRSKNVTEEMKSKWNRITEEIDDDANVNYIVTQFLEYAQSLYDIQLSNTREVLEIAIQVAQALSVCKAKGFTHQDLHFHNILFEETEDPEEINYEFPFGFRLNSRYRVTILDYDASEIVDPLEATNGNNFSASGWSCTKNNCTRMCLKSRILFDQQTNLPVSFCNV